MQTNCRTAPAKPVTLCLVFKSDISVALGEEKTKGMSDEDMSHTIDEILAENDSNRDGYVDYPEFITAQRGTV